MDLRLRARVLFRAKPSTKRFPSSGSMALPRRVFRTLSRPRGCANPAYMQSSKTKRTYLSRAYANILTCWRHADITSRFLNVISLFNGTIPLIAIQMQALKVQDDVTLVFTTVMDELVRGGVDEDEEVQEVTDRGYWDSRGSKATLGMVDQVLSVIHEFDPALELKYNKFYIGMSKDGQAPQNFVIFRPRKNILALSIRLKQSAEVESILEESGLGVFEYDKREGAYRIRLGIEELKNRRDVLRKLIGLAYREQTA